jgi:tRNA(fMet)-specific endonuclease VapC
MKRTYMLDTDTVSFAIRGIEEVGARLVEHAPSQLCISSITLAELRFGAEHRGSKKLHRLIDTFIRSVPVEPFDDVAATKFGAVAAALIREGTPIGELDAMIAAHALSLELRLVTNNTKHFSRVPHLRIETWV